MALPEGTKLRKGDVVALHGTVKFNENEDGNIFLDMPGTSSCMVGLDQIAGIVSRRFDIGETVKAQGYRSLLSVEGVSKDGGTLWLYSPDSGFITIKSEGVQLVEPQPEPVEGEGAAQ